MNNDLPASGDIVCATPVESYAVGLCASPDGAVFIWLRFADHNGVHSPRYFLCPEAACLLAADVLTKANERQIYVEDR